jgi:hypothetical protein
MQTQARMTTTHHYFVHGVIFCVHDSFIGQHLLTAYKINGFVSPDNQFQPARIQDSSYSGGKIGFQLP